jgi:hypothetical protein
LTGFGWILQEDGKVTGSGASLAIQNRVCSDDVNSSVTVKIAHRD